MMNRPRKRRAAPTLLPLESRCLLSLSGTWLGQDGHDFAGPSSALGPDGVQDIHIALAGLPADRTVTFADIQGLGGDEWQYDGTGDTWAADLIRAPGSMTADLYIEPARVETGRPFSIALTFDDGSTASTWVTGGTANPGLRMPAATLAVGWVGQDGHDLVGPGQDVGPDNIQDVHLTLSGLASGVAIASATVTGPGGEAWQFGLNPQAVNNAELVRDPADPSQADLYIAPLGNMAGQTLTVTVAYADGTSDTATVVAGPTDPNDPMPAPPAPVLSWNSVSAVWLGQDGQDLSGPGSVHVAVSGLPAGKTVVAAVLDDGVAGSWAYQAPGTSVYVDPYANPLALRPDADPTRADLDFPPVRTEFGATMTLRLVFADGSAAVATFPGGPADPGLRTPRPAATSVVAHPGDDLDALANAYGTVHLSSGTYNLGAPLVLHDPVTITADPGTTLVFAQGPADPTWTAAIKVLAGDTTLDGFAVRFATPIRWTPGIDSGPAVIGTTDNFDGVPNGFKADLTFAHLDLMSPPAATSWVEAPRLFRLDTAASGQIVANTLKGGVTEVIGGPWVIQGNDYQGTVPGTYAASAFAGRDTVGLVLADNHVEPVGASGKTWRFLVLSQGGSGDSIRDNDVIGVGPMDSDTVPSANASEIILTEDYALHFEGLPAAVSPDGRVVQIAAPQGTPAGTGDVVAILSGPDAGQWRRIAQAISPTAYLLDSPLPPGSYAIAIATGFVGESYAGNTIDARGSSSAGDLVLVGNHYGTQVVGNTFLGGAEAFKITAAPTNTPDLWGWSHAPFLGGLIAGNTFEDTLGGGHVAVEHSPAIKTDAGRVYFTATLQDNTTLWTPDFLARRAQASATGSLLALTIGDPGAIDPGELVVQERGDRVRGPVGMLLGVTEQVNAAILNGRAVEDEGIVLPTAPPAAPTDLHLVDGTAPGGATADGRLAFSGVLGAAGYEYRVGAATAFLPAGLAPGTNMVSVRAFDDAGRRGPVATITFTDLVSHPAMGIWLGQDGQDHVGPWSVVQGDGFQDVHIALSGLPADRTIVSLDVRGLGGGEWTVDGPPGGPWAALLVRAPGATTADLFLQPYQVETGRPFWVLIRHDDGSTSGFWVAGGAADPDLRMPAPAPPGAGGDLSAAADSGNTADPTILPGIPVLGPIPAPTVPPAGPMPLAVRMTTRALHRAVRAAWAHSLGRSFPAVPLANSARPHPPHRPPLGARLHAAEGLGLHRPARRAHV